MGTDFSQDPQENQLRRSRPNRKSTKMKLAVISLISSLCLLGLVIEGFADSYGSGGGYGGQYSYYPVPFGYGGYGGQQFGGGAGNGGFFALIGLLFIILLLFSGVFNFTSTSTTTTPVISTVG